MVGTDSYIDDIIVNEADGSCDRVLGMLASYGLVVKPPEPLIGGGILGVKVIDEADVIKWGRDNKVSSVDEVKTKRQAFSLCGQLLGHYPVAGWLRPACSFIERTLTEQGWDDELNDSARGIYPKQCPK